MGHPSILAIFIEKRAQTPIFFGPNWPNWLLVFAAQLGPIRRSQLFSFYGDSIPMPPPGHPDHPVGAEVTQKNQPGV